MKTLRTTPPILVWRAGSGSDVARQPRAASLGEPAAPSGDDVLDEDLPWEVRLWARSEALDDDMLVCHVCVAR